MSTSSKTVKTTFCLVSDTHDRDPKPGDADQFAFREPLPSADVLLHAGDLTMIGELRNHKNVLNWIKSVDAELKIVIAGNHDIDLHAKYYLRHSGEEPEVAWQQIEAIKELWTGPEARNAGVIYLDEGLNTFKLRSGAQFTVGVLSITKIGLSLSISRSIPHLGSLSSSTGHSIILAMKTATIPLCPLQPLRPLTPSRRGRQWISC